MGLVKERYLSSSGTLCAGNDATRQPCPLEHCRIQLWKVRRSTQTVYKSNGYNKNKYHIIAYIIRWNLSVHEGQKRCKALYRYGWCPSNISHTQWIYPVLKQIRTKSQCPQTVMITICCGRSSYLEWRWALQNDRPVIESILCNANHSDASRTTQPANHTNETMWVWTQSRVWRQSSRFKSIFQGWPLDDLLCTNSCQTLKTGFWFLAQKQNLQALHNTPTKGMTSSSDSLWSGSCSWWIMWIVFN